MSNKRLFIIFSLVLSCLYPFQVYAQKEIFKGKFYDNKEKIQLTLNLYDQTVTIPGMSFLGKTHGYMQGNIYGIWMVTSYKIKKDKAIIRLSNDLGSDSQTIEFSLLNDSSFKYNVVDGNRIKRVHKRKLVKIPEKLHFSRIK